MLLGPPRHDGLDGNAFRHDCTGATYWNFSHSADAHPPRTSLRSAALSGLHITQMPVLSNPKHERFAQELAKGIGTEEAHVTAGFKRNRFNAAALARKQHILTRVSEILGEREQIHAQSTAEAVQRVALSKEWVLSQLIENAQRAMQAIPVVVGGVQTGEYRYEGSIANRSLELLGKELGMFIDRKEQGAPGDFAELDSSSLREAIAARLAMARSGDKTAGLAGIEGSGRGKPH